MQSAPTLLRAWMTRAKLNQRETAELLGIDPVSFSHFLNGKRRPTLENAVAIEQHTGVPAERWVLSELRADAETVDSPTHNASLSK